MTTNAKRLVLCLDGTWGNPYQMKERDDGTGVLKPSNPLKMARAVLPWDAEGQVAQLTFTTRGSACWDGTPASQPNCPLRRPQASARSGAGFRPTSRRR